MKIFIIFLILLIYTCCFSQNIKFASFGDYGYAGSNELAVSNLVKSWNPDLIITLGDNNYDNGAASTIDANIGQYYHSFIYNYIGSYGAGDSIAQFLPCLGNHDWLVSGAQPYIDYFTLPNNERYYDFVKGNVHFFNIDSDPHEPDGITFNSIQGQWLQTKLQQATERWKVVYFHHPPYSSGSSHGSNSSMQWPFRQWGASLVLSGHEHNYERLNEGGLTYIVNGLGGRSLYPFGTPISGSQFRYNSDFGALLINSYNDSLVLKFYNKSGSLIDNYKILPDVNSITLHQVAGIPVKYKLYQNYPNPFNPSTNIKFDIPFFGKVKLTIYNSAGKVIKNLLDRELNSGSYQYTWDTGEDSYPSGVYFYKLNINEFQESGKMILVK
jgi:hypothetical protein